jgi:hypothetical protein
MRRHNDRQEIADVKQQHIRDGLLFVALVAIAVASRLTDYFPPNAHAVAAAALLAGLIFSSRIVALCVPLLAMMISDSIIGGHDGLVMATVYGSLVLPVAFSGLLKRQWMLAPIAALFSSVIFYLATNFAHWVSFGDRMQEASWTLAGLIHCYAIALPFFKFTLAGDLGYTVVLFGAYGLFALAKSQNREPGLALQTA